MVRLPAGQYVEVLLAAGVGLVVAVQVLEKTSACARGTCRENPAENREMIPKLDFVVSVVPVLA